MNKLQIKIRGSLRSLLKLGFNNKIIHHNLCMLDCIIFLSTVDLILLWDQFSTSAPPYENKSLHSNHIILLQINHINKAERNFFLFPTRFLKAWTGVPTKSESSSAWPIRDEAPNRSSKKLHLGYNYHYQENLYNYQA